MVRMTFARGRQRRERGGVGGVGDEDWGIHRRPDLVAHVFKF